MCVNGIILYIQFSKPAVLQFHCTIRIAWGLLKNTMLRLQSYQLIRMVGDGSKASVSFLRSPGDPDVQQNLVTIILTFSFFLVNNISWIFFLIKV